MKLHKKFGTHLKKDAGKASAEDLALINTIAVDEMTADDVYVRTTYLAHNGIDRDKEVFDDALLEAFATTLPGKGLFIKHPMSWDGDSGPGVGRWYAARVVEMSLDEARVLLREPDLQFPESTQTAKLLEASFYIPRSDKNVALIADIDAGVAGDVSIGFHAADRSPITDGKSSDVVAYRILAPGEAYEGSLVWLGAQPGARVFKSAKRSGDSSALLALQQENARLKKTVDHLIAKQFKLLDLVKRGAPASATVAEAEKDITSILHNPLLHGDPTADAIKARHDYRHRDQGVPLPHENAALRVEKTPAVASKNGDEDADRGVSDYEKFANPLTNPALKANKEKLDMLNNPAITGVKVAA